MLTHGFSVADESTVVFGGKKYRLQHHAERNGVVCGIEVAGKERSGYDEIFEIEQLRNVRVMDLPKGFDLSIYQPQFATYAIDSLTIKHVYGLARINFSVYYEYATWKHRVNLRRHCKELAGRFISDIEESYESLIQVEDASISVGGWTEIDPSLDLYDYLLELNNRVAQLQLPSKEEDHPHISKPHHLKPDERGLMWWARYVVVPLICSAGLVALISLLARQS